MRKGASRSREGVTYLLISVEIIEAWEVNIFYWCCWILIDINAKIASTYDVYKIL